MENNMRMVTRSKGKKTMAGVLSLTLALLVFAFAAPAQADVATTVASVAFTDGELIMEVDPSGSNLDFDFGKHRLPITAVSYPAENKEAHILSVEDGRVKSGSWSVFVSLTSFTDAGGDLGVMPFDATINLKSPTIKNANAAAGTEGLTVSNDIKVTSNGGDKLVMQANATLKRGIYSLEWSNDNVTLNMSDAQVSNIDLKAYTALVSWTLNIGPQ